MTARLTRRMMLGAATALVAAPAYSQGSSPARSDDFRSGRLGAQWTFLRPSANEQQRLRFHEAGVFFSGVGATATDSPALVCAVADRRFDASVTIDLYDGGEGGLLVFSGSGQFSGIGFMPHTMKAYAASREEATLQRAVETQSVRVGVSADGDALVFRYSHDSGKTWTPHGLRARLGAGAPRLGLYSAQNGQIRLRDFTYRALG